MSKNAKQGDKTTTSSKKKGIVVQRRYNRTVNQDVSHQDPKWEDVGGKDSPVGILRRVARRGQVRVSCYIRRGKGGRWENCTQRDVDIALAPREAPEVSEEKAAA